MNLRAHAYHELGSKFYNYCHDMDKGYVVRVGCVGAIVAFGASSVFTRFKKAQYQKPLAQRWYSILPATPITLVERRIEAGDQIEIFRFKLPNSYDYCGFDPISAVRLGVPGRGIKTMWIWRFYNPISPPDARGYVEFAIGQRRTTSGYMRSHLRELKVGDTMYLGRWMKEFPYKPNTYGEIGVVSTSSGVSVVLQLLNAMEKDKTDTTKLRVLYCNHLSDIAFKDTVFADASSRHPTRFFFDYLIENYKSGMTWTGRFPSGRICDEVLGECMPKPFVPKITWVKNSETGKDEERKEIIPSKMLVVTGCKTQGEICGQSTGFMNSYYIQGFTPKLRFENSILERLGFSCSQVYRFGNPHPMWGGTT